MSRPPSQSDLAILHYAGSEYRVRGRALRLILWVALRQQHLNDAPSDAGHLLISWKGDTLQSINATVKYSI